jgi:hypothetical protein
MIVIYIVIMGQWDEAGQGFPGMRDIGAVLAIQMLKVCWKTEKVLLIVIPKAIRTHQ